MSGYPMRNANGVIQEPRPQEAPRILSSSVAERLRYLEASARVRRWHTEDVLHQQTVGEHTYTVMHLVLLLTGGNASRNLLVAALLHDTAERMFGDIPSPTKRLGEFKEKLDALEDTFLRDIGVTMPDLSEEEARMLKLADGLEGGLYCAFEVRRGNVDMRRGFANYLNYIQALLQPQDGFAAGVYNQLMEEYNRVFSR